MRRTELLARAEALRPARTPFVLATVVRAQRPTSAKPGDSALILADGTIDGFVGGTCAESTVRLQGLRLLETGESTLLRITPDPSIEGDGRRRRPRACSSSTTRACPAARLEIFLEAMIPAAAALRATATRRSPGRWQRIGAAAGLRHGRPASPDTPSDRRRTPRRSSSPRTVTARRRCWPRRLRPRCRTSRWWRAGSAATPYWPASAPIAIACTRRPASTSAPAPPPRSRSRSSPRSSRPDRRRRRSRTGGLHDHGVRLRSTGRDVGRAGGRDRPGLRDGRWPSTPIALQAEHGGQTYYFCGSGCKVAFTADPHRYLTGASHG